MNHEDEVGITINLRSIYEQLQKQTDVLSDMRTTSAIQAKDIKDMKEENVKLREEVEKLRTRFNGILVGLGAGIIVGLPTLFALLK